VKQPRQRRVKGRCGDATELGDLVVSERMRGAQVGLRGGDQLRACVGQPPRRRRARARRSRRVELDDPAGSISHFQRALDLNERAGRRGEELADEHSSLALSFADLGRDGEARAEAERAIAQYEAVGADPSASIDAWNVLSEVEHRAGRNASPLAYARKVVAVLHGHHDNGLDDVREFAAANIRSWTR
jgi:hypothetical protein